MPQYSNNMFWLRRREFHSGAFFIFICLILFLLPHNSFSEMNIQPARALTLKDSINVALMNNKSIQIQEQGIDFAKANILDAKSRFLPQVDASYGYTYNDAILALGSGTNSRKDPQIFSGFQNNNLVTLAFDESIYNGGADIANLGQARVNMKIQKETLRAARLEVEFETKRLFYGLLLAYETKRIAEDLVKQAQAHYEKTKSRFEQGTASKFDVLQSKVQVSRLMPQLVNANNAIEQIMVEFKKLLSLDMREDFFIDGAFKYRLVDIREEDFLHEAYRNRPEMKLKLLGVDMNRWAIEFAKAGWLPQISASANYLFNANDVPTMFNTRNENWNIGVRASIAIFDGFATKAKVDEAKARYNQSVLEKQDYVDQIAVDVKTACLDLKQAKAIIDSQGDSIVEAKEALRLSEVRFDNGVGINLDVLDAQVALAQVEENLAQGIYDYIMAKAQLDRTMGREFFEEAQDGAKS